MTLSDKIFNKLVVERAECTVAQLASMFGVPKSSVRARVTEIRDMGYCIYSNQRVDTKGRVKNFYRHGSPSLADVQMARAAQRLMRKLGL